MNRNRVVYALLVLVLMFAVPIVVGAEEKANKTLPETFTSEDGTISINYPTGWYVDTIADGQIWVSTTSTPRFGEMNLRSGQAGVAVMFMDNQRLGGQLYGGSDPLAILNTLIDSVTSWDDDSGIGFDEPFATTLNDHPAALVEGRYGDSEIFLMIVNHGLDKFSMVVGYASEGELVKVEPKLLAIAESTVYQIPSNL